MTKKEKEILAWVKQAKADGASRSDIEEFLISIGYKKKKIHKVMNDNISKDIELGLEYDKKEKIQERKVSKKKIIIIALVVAVLVLISIGAYFFYEISKTGKKEYDMEVYIERLEEKDRLLINNENVSDIENNFDQTSVSNERLENSSNFKINNSIAEVIDDGNSETVNSNENITDFSSEIVNECEKNYDCDDGDLSTKDLCLGELKVCYNNKITDCIMWDDYCPANCNYDNDNDCKPVHECMVASECDDRDKSTIDECMGYPRECVNTEISSCINDDDYCPDFCLFEDDNDCKEGDCDNDDDCDDGDFSTEDLCLGNPSKCKYIDIDTCNHDDGYCPYQCGPVSDNDCIEDECKTDEDCDDGNDLTIDTCDGEPKVCTNE